MFREDGSRPSDQRGFLHKKLLGFGLSVAKRIPGIGTAVQIGEDVVRTLRPPARRTIPRPLTARPSIGGEQEKALGRDIKFGNGDAAFLPFTEPSLALTTRQPSRRPPPGFGGGGRNGTADDCPSGTVPDPEGRGFCVSPRSRFGKGSGARFAPVGDAVMGRYGAALEPGIMVIDRSVCLRGMQLGDDGLCYNKGQITNKQRMWPRGRKPLLTGGEMRAIGIASRAGKRVDATAKRLRELGMMKKLPSPKAKPHAHAKAATGVVSL